MDLEDAEQKQLLSKFKMSTINQIDPKERSTILIFPIINKDEAKVPEIAEILIDIMDDVDFSKKQREENLLLIKGDLLSVRNIRSGSCQLNQLMCSDWPSFSKVKIIRI